MHLDDSSSGFGAVRGIMDWQQLGERRNREKLKSPIKWLAKGQLFYLQELSCLEERQKKKKKYQDKHFLPVMIRSCCLQRSDYTVSQMFKKKKSQQPLSTLTIAAAELSVSLCTKQSGNIALLFL